MVKYPSANVGDTGLILRLGKSPGEGNGKPLQDSCLGNSMDRNLAGYIVLGGGSQRAGHN